MTSGEKLAAKVEAFADNLEDGTRSGVNSGMRTTEQFTENNLRDNDSVVNRGLISSVESETDTVNAGYHSASVRVNAPYAPYVEYGTGSMQRGGTLKFKSPDPRPPLGPIKQWLIRKGTPMDSIRDVTLKEFGDVYINQQQTLDNLAQAIADQIGAHGNRPHPYARPAAREGFDFTTSEVAREMRRAVRRF